MVTVRKATPEEIEMAKSWPTWDKTASTFDWEYDEQETCYITKGKAKVTTPKGDSANFAAGDWVIFPKGLKCTWEIIEDIEKHYKFGD